MRKARPRLPALELFWRQFCVVFFYFQDPRAGDPSPAPLPDLRPDGVDGRRRGEGDGVVLAVWLGVRQLPGGIDCIGGPTSLSIQVNIMSHYIFFVLHMSADVPACPGIYNVFFSLRVLLLSSQTSYLQFIKCVHRYEASTPYHIPCVLRSYHQ